MRIAFDHQIFGWQQYGGVSRYFYELAKNIAVIPDHQVKIISPLYVNRYISSPVPGLVVEGVKVPALPKTGRIYRAFNSLLARSMLRSFQPDIVHETYYSATRLAPPRAKVIVSVYDMIHERFNKNFSQMDPTSREKALSVERADHVICISEHTRKDLIELFRIPEKKTSVVHLGFSLAEETEVEDNDWRPPQRPYLLYVGNRGGYKNFTCLLDAYAESKALRAHYDIVCFGGGPFTTRERRRMKEFGLAAATVRQISGSDGLLARFYRSATVFVYPSLYEGFGIPPLEAMGFDCPVVCSNASSIPEVVGDAAELFDPNDLLAMRLAMERVAFDQSRKNTLIEKGRSRLRLFSWERCAQETLAIYEKVLS